ncbi:hypothetical protein JYU34_001669 [Plutella xylostella]|uniref:Uncharacterized protein n=1 Tax=Plutella xylostella TaxID=51655 RepID=A0ABQ7R4H3_PLUXY|nr:uncharacterized protein LOC105390638 [Plutella xylostella]XP_037973074.1 uncharacterized protein LOC105390638 [Plutella xylostella]KAG7312201.1 hypothetical protein JYU34_001669 [Plutella xylostella]
MCEDKEEVRGAGEGSPRVPCWRRRAPAPLPDTRGLCCAKLLRKNGKPKKVLLFPEEGWARSASSSYWTLQPSWWRRERCKVVEVAGTRRHSTHARMVASGGNAVHVVGTFKHMGTDADFKLYLTTNVTQADFNMGYTMTGTLERGCRSTNTFQVTHFAVLRRCDHDATHLKNA